MMYSLTPVKFKKNAKIVSDALGLSVTKICHSEKAKKKARRKKRAFSNSYLVGRGRLERPTNGLKVRCSTN